MQSDAFPTPPIYGYLFQPRLLQPFTGFDDEPTSISKLAENDPDNDRCLEKLHSYTTYTGTHTGSPANTQVLNALLSDIETLIIDCSSDESQLFWSTIDCIKLKHQVVASMQKIETLFLDLAKTATKDPNLVAALSEGLLYAGAGERSQRD